MNIRSLFMKNIKVQKYIEYIIIEKIRYQIYIKISLHQHSVNNATLKSINKYLIILNKLQMRKIKSLDHIFRLTF